MFVFFVAVPPRYMDYYGGSGYGYGGGSGYGYDDYYCNYGGTGGGYDDYGGYEEYDFYSPMPYGMPGARGGGRLMYQVFIWSISQSMGFVKRPLQSWTVALDRSELQ